MDDGFLKSLSLQARGCGAVLFTIPDIVSKLLIPVHDYYHYMYYYYIVFPDNH